tara:strand:- start:361 stop:780 length:420 start_codon:yes stop_codon:yes gene_type:complete
MDSFRFKKYNFKYISENIEQGAMKVFESDDLPFALKRVFTVIGAKKGAKRGNHAHKICNQILCCISGRINLICDNGVDKINIILDSRSEAILVPSGIWAEQEYLDNNSALIVFCDQPFDEDDYIRSYKEYLHWKINNEL